VVRTDTAGVIVSPDQRTKAARYPCRTDGDLTGNRYRPPAKSLVIKERVPFEVVSASAPEELNCER